MALASFAARKIELVPQKHSSAAQEGLEVKTNQLKSNFVPIGRMIGQSGSALTWGTDFSCFVEAVRARGEDDVRYVHGARCPGFRNRVDGWNASFTNTGANSMRGDHADFLYRLEKG